MFISAKVKWGVSDFLYALYTHDMFYSEMCTYATAVFDGAWRRQGCAHALVKIPLRKFCKEQSVRVYVHTCIRRFHILYNILK